MTLLYHGLGNPLKQLWTEEKTIAGMIGEKLGKGARGNKSLGEV